MPQHAPESIFADMTTVQHQVSLRAYNTFGFDVPAAAFVAVDTEADVQALIRDTALPRPFLVLGGGSNVLLTKPVAGTVVLNRIGGIEVVREAGDTVWIRAGAGVNWHEFVLDTLDRGLSGVENLALIPGTVGASPIQNIGAYGVEVKDAIDGVRFVRWSDGEARELTASDCCFGYRDSLFKGALHGTGIVTAVTFRLSRTPRLQTGYGAIRDELARAGIEAPNPRDVAEAVIAIRRSKLPDPAVVGNAGSFFKNPTLPRPQYDALLAQHPGIPHYPAGDGRVKVPAGWLIEQCGWKGQARGGAGVHDRQALVLVNRGAASGTAIWDLSEAIVRDVQARYDITLEREVQIW